VHQKGEIENSDYHASSAIPFSPLIRRRAAQQQTIAMHGYRKEELYESLKGVNYNQIFSGLNSLPTAIKQERFRELRA
jgi:hypothetical protein